MTDFSVELLEISDLHVLYIIGFWILGYNIFLYSASQEMSCALTGQVLISHSPPYVAAANVRKAGALQRIFLYLPLDI